MYLPNASSQNTMIYIYLDNGKNATNFEILRVSCKLLYNVNLITTLSADATKSLQCKGIFLSDVT